MPGRRYTGRPLQAQQETRPKQSSVRKQKKRAQNALAVAEAGYEEDPGLKKSRLHDIDQAFRKRQRDDDDEESDRSSEEAGTGQGQRKRAKSSLRDRYGKDAEYGSDSEGNEWVTGQVDDEDDESLDSDAAFGESDEERFESFTFRGSKGQGSKSRTKSKATSGNILDESDQEQGQEEGSDAESENFAENAVDLHTMLDTNGDEDGSESDRDDGQNNQGLRRDDLLDGRSSDSNKPLSEDNDDRSALFNSDEDDENEFTSDLRSKALMSMVSGLSNGDTAATNARKAQERANELLEPGAIVTLPELAELTADIPKSKPSKKVSQGLPGKVEVPLAQRQQGRLDRAAAFQQSKETLARWIDTVKQNRRAEHLSFPLINQDEASAKNNARFRPLDARKPFNEMEATIQSILAENGMRSAAADSQDQDGEDFQLEGAPVAKLSLEDVLAQRAELRKARELIFREEIKAKRIKKIKSKAYRRVHRKAKERELQKRALDRDSGDEEADEDAQDRLDKLRAEERMGAKHRESKWAKAMKATGRTAWDEEARNDMLDMARREEELKRRIHGKAIRDDASLPSLSSSEDESDEEDGNEGIQNKLFKLRDESGLQGKGSKLANMSFMRRAEAAQREQNEATIAQIQRDLDGVETPSDDSDAEGPARRKFGQKPAATSASKASVGRNEFEEREASEVEDFEDQGDEIQVTVKPKTTVRNGTSQTVSKLANERKRAALSQNKGLDPPAAGNDDENDWEATLHHVKTASGQNDSDKTPVAQQSNNNDWEGTLFTMDKSSRKKSAKRAAALEAEPFVLALSGTNDRSLTKQPQSQPPPIKIPLNSSKSHALNNGNDQDKQGDDDSTSSSGSDSDPEPHVRLSSQRTALQRAFAGDETVANFEAEKLSAAAAERTPTPEPDVMPGWGSWAGAGLSKRDRRGAARKVAVAKREIRDSLAAKKRAGPRGGRPGKIDQTRRDANLPNVIISERRMPTKTTSKYLAPALPHPYESRQQYERSLRMPVGPEWTTKQSFQTATKPRLLLGGGVIRPMERPSI